MKLVKFSNGMFGLRKGFFVKRYLDFSCPEYWRRKSSRHFKDCQVTEERAKDCLRNMKISDQVIE